jgi:hypothetical protein
MEIERDTQIYIAAILLAIMMFTGGMSILYSGEVEQLPLRHPPVAPPPEETVTRELRFQGEYYKTLLAEDARRFGVKAPTVAELAKPLRHIVEFSGRQRLQPRKEGGLDTEHLKLRLSIAKEWAHAPGGGFTAPHAILHISNKSDKHLAYHIVTDTIDRRRCLNKSDLTHNAIALAPGEEVARTECTVDSLTEIVVTRVEVVELSPLSYHYLCRVPPGMLLLDERTAGGHLAGRGKPCPPIAWAEIKAGAEAKDVAWLDVVDYYARHSCDEYTFFRGYRFRDREGPLPARRTGTTP